MTPLSLTPEKTRMANANHPILDYLEDGLLRLADPSQAAPMQAYMKTNQPFRGVKSTPRRELFRAAIKRHPIETRADYRTVILALWRGVYREENYLALDVAERVKKFRDLESWPLYDQLVQTSPWWDTLDWIAAKIAGPLVLRHRELETELVRWRGSDNMWVRRASLLAFLKHKRQTHTSLLGETILLLAHEQEFSYARPSAGCCVSMARAIQTGCALSSLNTRTNSRR
ncbi:MAG: DNA alkylation repair protein [Caldilineaceae bacterium]|nr:DNA alkylation repair protein [Caldilineaceae bacterium]